MPAEPPHDPPPQRDVWLALILGSAYVVWAVRAFGDTLAVDLWPVYLAGHFYAAGALDQVYPSGSVFDLGLPDAWLPYLAARIEAAPTIYPFIYPPLWAAVASWITPYTTLQGWTLASAVIDPVLVVATCALAWRTSDRRMPAWVWIGATLVLLTGTSALYLALRNHQAQLLATFAIVAAIERSHAGRDRTAGALLAFAASLKLYPVLFVGLWVARGRWSAVGAFAGVGLLLGLGSVALTGWPLHVQFLESTRAIAGTLLHHPNNHSLDASVAQVLAMTGASSFGSENPDVRLALVKPAALSWAGRAVLVGVVAGSMRWARGCTEADLYRRVWPVTLLAVSLASPLAWTYHFLTGLVFVPLLLDRSRSLLLTLLLLVPLTPLVVSVRQLGGETRGPQVVLTLVMVAFAVLFATHTPDHAESA